MKRWWLSLLLPLTLFALDGRSVYEKKCAGCHKLYVPAEELMANFLEHNNTLLHLEAPTVNQLAYRLKQQIGDPKGDKDVQLMEVAAFVHEYVLAPDRQKSVCMPEVMVHFETMPSLKGKITDEELEAVAEWIYWYTPPQKVAGALRFVDFEAAKKEAKATGRGIMIEVTSPTCHYCKKMERTTLADPEVVAAVTHSFVPVRVDVSKERLPEGLSWSLTPTFFFLTADGRLFKTVPGAWVKEDFLQILHEAKGAM
ncbi:thioredoxin family protein [Hydrogenimonas sp.]